ncbi:MAG: zf-HC2 domain-containing protein [Candidatus Competibacteraceae bacterium]|nr:MAG: zf-HC2 domain-containing protein [Candidatus Competibacteraceae bacterium]
MLTCHQVTQLLSEAQDRPLRLKEKLPLKFHLLICSGCNNFRQQLDFLRRACRQYPASRSDSPRS